MRISILALEGLWDTGLTVTLDAFTLANKFSAAQMGGTLHFDVSIVGVRKKVRSGQGFAIPVKAVTPDLKPDWVIVPALNTGRPEQLIPALERRDVSQAKEQLRRWHAAGARIAASCIGTFLLAEAGLLDQQGSDDDVVARAVVSATLSECFARRVAHAGAIRLGVTAGAAMGHLDLALWLIRQASPELAAVVSRYLLADLRSSQAPFIIPNHLAQADPLIQRFERWARDHLKEGFSLQEAADALATSARTLQRRCEAVLGKSPLSYFQDLRVERAQSLLHGSGLDVDAIAAEVGYVDGATLRTLLRERLGRGVRELRADLR